MGCRSGAPFGVSCLRRTKLRLAALEAPLPVNRRNSVAGRVMERSTSLERLGRNEFLFREVNERIREVAGTFGALDVALFVCECGRANCSEAIELQLDEYDALRSSNDALAMVPGHEAPHETIARRGSRYNAVLAGRERPGHLQERNA